MATQAIDLNNVLKLEDVRLQDINSVETYITELEWYRRLIDGHIRRCKVWKDTDADQRRGLGKLNLFLEELEA